MICYSFCARALCCLLLPAQDGPRWKRFSLQHFVLFVIAGACYCPLAIWPSLCSFILLSLHRCLYSTITYAHLPPFPQAPQPLTQRQCTEAADAYILCRRRRRRARPAPPFLAALDTLLAARRRKTIDVSEFLRLSCPALSCRCAAARCQYGECGSRTDIARPHCGRIMRLGASRQDRYRILLCAFGRNEIDLCCMCVLCGWEQRLAVFEDMRRQSQPRWMQTDGRLHRTDVLQSVRRAMADRGLVDVRSWILFCYLGEKLILLSTGKYPGAYCALGTEGTGA